MSISELTVSRAASVASLVDHITAAATAFKQLESDTCAMSDILYHIQKARRPDAKIVINPVQNLDDIRRKVQLVVDHLVFGPDQNCEIDLVATVTGENAAALREVSNG